MWVVVVCFCLFLSGLYLYIIIYKISIGIADCSITYYRYEADADLHATSAGDSTCESGHVESKTQTSKHATNRAQRAQALSKQITGLLIVVAQAPLLSDHWSWLKTPNRQRANTPNTKHRAQRAGAYAHAQMRNVHTDMTHGRGSGNEHKQAHTSQQHFSMLMNRQGTVPFSGWWGYYCMLVYHTIVRSRGDQIH